MGRIFLSISRVFGIFVAIVGLIAGYYHLVPLSASSDGHAVALVSGLSSLLIATTIEIIFLLSAGEQNTQNLRPQVRLVTGDRNLKKEMYDGPDSVVQSAKEFLIVTGSRSRDGEYLRAIEKRVLNCELTYTRILIGPPQKSELVDHLSRMRSAVAGVEAWPRDKVIIVEAAYGDEWPERFICANESKVVIITQSPNAPLAYDTGIVIDETALAGRVAGQLKALAETLHRRHSNGSH